MLHFFGGLHPVSDLPGRLAVPTNVIRLVQLLGPFDTNGLDKSLLHIIVHDFTLGDEVTSVVSLSQGMHPLYLCSIPEHCNLQRLFPM